MGNCGRCLCEEQRDEAIGVLTKYQWIASRFLAMFEGDTGGGQVASLLCPPYIDCS